MHHTAQRDSHGLDISAKSKRELQIRTRSKRKR